MEEGSRRRDHPSAKMGELGEALEEDVDGGRDGATATLDVSEPRAAIEKREILGGRDNEVELLEHAPELRRRKEGSIRGSGAEVATEEVDEPIATEDLEVNVEGLDGSEPAVTLSLERER